MSAVTGPPAPPSGQAAAPAREGVPAHEVPRAGDGSPAAAPPGSGPARRNSEPLRLAAFAALALYGGLHWAGLVVEPPTGRFLVLLALATGGAAALVWLARVRRPLPRFAAAAAVSIGVLALGLVVAGLEGRLLLPANWVELGDGLDRGLSGIRAVNWPYDGPDPWVRLTILLGCPLLAAVAAALAFWPARRGRVALRFAGLAVLLVLYGTAVTEHDPGQPVLRGFVLLFLVAAWLWLPRLQPREAATAAAAVLAVGICAIPLSARLDGERPWWDYRAWDWFGAGKAVSFDWSHRYGPLDWPRDGTTMLNVRAERPHYWKAETLDAFDGFRWLRSERNGNTRLGAEVPPQEQYGERWDYFEYNPRWEERIRFRVRSLASSLVIGAGITTEVRGVEAVPTADGTTPMSEGALEDGDSYSVTAYVPDPTSTQLAGAPEGYSQELAQYTQVTLPPPGASALEADEIPGQLGGVAGGNSVFVPLWGEPETGTPDAAGQLLGSDYARVYRLARRLTDGASTVYDAVRRLELHLQRNYAYSERVPSHDVPLSAFLFEDEAGYCQHFSGAMALMLRMVGIPARVATGFTRGSFNSDTGEWRVRDLDAHSWVEVHFTGVGWVNFDPTPSAAPAEGQSSGLGATGPGGSGSLEPQGSERGTPSERGGEPQRAGSEGDGPAWWLLPVLFVAIGLVAASVLVLRATRARRDLGPAGAAELQLAELRRALERVGWKLPGGVTLLALERRLRRVAGPLSAAYAEGLREYRYDPTSAGPPALRERRALRRELGSVGGFRQRLRALVAIPPWGPRR